MNDRARILTETADARADAERLLAGLIDARSKSEARLAELSRSDILKNLTGKSALDNAINSTQRMIDSLDRVLVELRTKLSPEEIALLDELDKTA
ncbi:MAG: hypothetical protein KDA31_01610 [Phycisphaerales bacterium]|nr:hypothetical protein [Phycisphaerales bacterium]MCB9835198.1 hypothetical protein [Phycisphaera sp.]